MTKIDNNDMPNTDCGNDTPEEYVSARIGQFIDGDMLIDDDEDTKNICSQSKITLTTSNK